jgi:hypothetical protein
MLNWSCRSDSWLYSIGAVIRHPRIAAKLSTAAVLEYNLMVSILGSF